MRFQPGTKDLIAVLSARGEGQEGGWSYFSWVRGEWLKQGILNRAMYRYETSGWRVAKQLTCPMCGVTLAGKVSVIM